MSANKIDKILDDLTKKITVMKDMISNADSIVAFHSYEDIKKIRQLVDKMDKELQDARRLGVWGTDY